ncbi:MAG: hypothetical protein LBO03_10085 [Acidaminococcales bacterium]|jgi:hypothetical protein|nr:hypothetical protein [Acidaminococcales bacterium]
MWKKIIIPVFAVIMLVSAGTVYSGIPGIGGGKSKSSSSSVDVDGLSKRQNELLQKLSASVSYFEGAKVLVAESVKLFPPEKIASQRKAIEDFKSGKNSNIGDSYKALESNSPSSEQLKAKLAEPRDAAEEAALKSAVQTAENLKVVAYGFTLAAALDAPKIVADASAGLKDMAIASKLNGIIKTVNAAKDILTAQKKAIEDYNAAVSDYKSRAGVTTPSDKDALKAVESMDKG